MLIIKIKYCVLSTEISQFVNQFLTKIEFLLTILHLQMEAVQEAVVQWSEDHSHYHQENDP
jgi:hypothetical protein